jgi:putative transposase
MEYKKSSHATYDCRYHLVWITKYRNWCINERMEKRLKVIIQWICNRLYVWILKIWMEEDHIHMYISIPLSKPIPYVVQQIKWWTSKVIRKEFKEHLKEYYWRSNHLWAVWYFIASVWEINWDLISKYVEQQWHEENIWTTVIL